MKLFEWVLEIQEDSKSSNYLVPIRPSASGYCIRFNMVSCLTGEVKQFDIPLKVILDFIEEEK